MTLKDTVRIPKGKSRTTATTVVALVLLGD